MKIGLNKAGVALILVLMIVVISAGLLSAIMYYALSGSEISGLQRKYETSKEASLGAIDVFTKELIPRALQDRAAGLSGATGGLIQGTGILNSVSPGTGLTNTCFLNKLTLPSASWGTGCSSTSSDPNVNPDVAFSLLSADGGRPFEVNLKIIDTARGNSSMSGIALAGEGTVDTGGGAIATRHIPYLYTITVEGRLQSSTTEKANFEILYAY